MDVLCNVDYPVLGNRFAIFENVAFCVERLCGALYKARALRGSKDSNLFGVGSHRLKIVNFIR